MTASQLPYEFAQKLSDFRMVFQRPPGSEPAPIVQNDSVIYDYAVTISPELEIRYKIVDTHELGPLSEVQSLSMLLSTIYNVAANMIAPPSQFPAQAVKNEFGADSGHVCRFLLKPSGFSSGFQDCMLVSLHRTGIAEAYIFFMYKDFEKVLDLIEKNYYALRFLG